MAKHPISEARIRSFGPFKDISVRMSDGLNIIIGDNASGKSQLLKLLYSSTKSLKDASTLTKRELSGDIASKLVGVYQPQQLGRLTRRVQGHSTAKVTVKFKQIAEPLAYAFSSRAKSEVVVESFPSRKLSDDPVFLPSHELLSLGARFIALYNAYDTGFEETWRDTVELLQRPALRGPRGEDASHVLEPFSKLLQGGSVVEKDGQFFLKQPGIGNLEAPLLAEGHRKLAMIVRLIANGVLLEGGYLFWDEPEANLNPASQKAVAEALVYLAKNGTQVFAATHSMFLLREIQMLAEENTPRYIGLHRQTSSVDTIATAEVAAQQGSDLDDLEFVAAMDAEAEQAERYFSW